MFNVLSGPERLLVADLDLPCAVLLAHHGLRRVLERVANGVIGGLGEQNFVACSFLHGPRADVWGVDDHILDVAVGVDVV